MTVFWRWRTVSLADQRPRALLTIGDVSVWALGEQRFRVQSSAGDEEVEGFAEARQRAQELADLAS